MSITLRDRAGNQNVDSIAFQFDDTPPSILTTATSIQSSLLVAPREVDALTAQSQLDIVIRADEFIAPTSVAELACNDAAPLAAESCRVEGTTLLCIRLPEHPTDASPFLGGDGECQADVRLVDALDNATAALRPEGLRVPST